MKILKLFNNNKIFYLPLLLIFICSRLIFLDQDAPSTFSMWDEMAYATTAFNLYEYGELAHQVVDWLPDDANIWNYQLLPNILTFITLKLFGDNYYGLRLPAVIASVITFMIILYFISTYLSKNNSLINRKKWEISLIIIFVLYIIINYPFLIASRIQEPTVFRIAAMMTVLFSSHIMLCEMKINVCKSFMLGVISGIACIAVYAQNFFIIPAFALIVFYLGTMIDIKKGLTYLFSFVIGSVLVCCIFYWFYNVVYEVDYFKTMAGYLNHSDLAAYRFKPDIIENVINIFKTNIFRMNFTFLFIFLFSVPIYILNIYRHRNLVDIMVGVLLLCIFLQSLFLNDFYHKKLLILFPLVLMVIIKVLVDFNETMNYLKRAKNSRIYILISMLLIFIMSLLLLLMKTARDISVYNGSDNIYVLIPDKFGLLTNELTLIFGFVAIFLLISTLGMLFYRNKIKLHPHYIKILTLLIIIISFTPDVYRSMRDVFIKPTYLFKYAQTNLGKYVNGKKMAADLSMFMRLYNTAEVFVNPYNKYGKDEEARKEIIRNLVNENKIDYILTWVIEDLWPEQKKEIIRSRYESLKELGFHKVERYDLPLKYRGALLFKLD